MHLLETFRLDGRVAIVTGASSGLGAALAEGFGAAGADVVVCGRRADRIRQTEQRVASSGGQCRAVQADVTKPEECERVVAAAQEAFGTVSILVNNAGLGAAVPATRETPEQFRAVVDVNLNGSYWMAQACGKIMQPGSAILNIGSVLGQTSRGLPQAAYASSKAAIIGLTRDLAQQWTGRKGIRVNALAPGFFHTEMTEEYPDGYLEAQQTRLPIGRAGEPFELVAAALFLVSDAASYITGVTLPVDGGLLTG